MPDISLQERIEAKSIPVPECGCWIWLAQVDRYGYGRIKLNGMPRQGHRASWIAYKGPIPNGLCVCHRCDIPPCVNPDHLFLGTLADNAQDMVRKGRNRSQFGHSVVGATYVARRRKWQAQLTVNGRNLYLGAFTELANAQAAYRAARERYANA